MALKQDHRNLRAAAPTAPTTTRPTLLGAAIAAALVAAEKEQGPLPMATAHARVRHSWAGMCARRIAYEVEGVTPTEPATENASAVWSFTLGRFAHQVMQDGLSAQWDGLESTIEHEVKLDCGVRAGTADTVIRFAEPVPFPVDGKILRARTVLLEYKSMGGFKFKQQVTEEGPARSAYLQAAMNAVAVGADAMVLCAMALDQMSPTVAARVYGPDFEAHERFWAEWWYPREVFEEDGLAEAARLEKIVELVDAGKLVPRHVPGEMPVGARITDPATGKWTEDQDGAMTGAGSFWGCAYCPFQSHCVAEKAAGR